MNIKPMNAEQFASILFELKYNCPIEFNVCQDITEATDSVSNGSTEYWYFANKMQVSVYGASFILLDNCWNGEKSFAIPLNHYGEINFDDMVRYTKTFFKYLSKTMNTPVDYVFVSVQEGD